MQTLSVVMDTIDKVFSDHVLDFAAINHLRDLFPPLMDRIWRPLHFLNDWGARLWKLNDYIRSASFFLLNRQHSMNARICHPSKCVNDGCSWVSYAKPFMIIPVRCHFYCIASVSWNPSLFQQWPRYFLVWDSNTELRSHYDCLRRSAILMNRVRFNSSKSWKLSNRSFLCYAK